MIAEQALVACALAAFLSPLVGLLVLAVASGIGRPLAETSSARVLRACFFASGVLLVVLGILMHGQGGHRLLVSLGEWFAAGDYGFHFRLLFDRLSLPFAVLSVGFCFVVSSFAERYLHREPGYNRFMVLLSVFGVGMLVTVLAGSLELVFVGWELVGISSALLVAFFQERRAPVENGLWTFSVYRLTDVGLLTATILAHGLCGSGDFDAIVGTQAWPGAEPPITGSAATILALLVLLSAAGKSAQVPFSGWLPRAMEGPTPSSAIFYGALSVHVGAFLLLRIGGLLAVTPVGPVVAVLGLVTAVYATLVGRAQTDVKTSLSYASLTQVGIIFVEVGLGLSWLALFHIIGHACVRCLQYLRAPNVLHDRHRLETAIRGHLPRTGLHLERLFPAQTQRHLYRFALERGYLDSLLMSWLVEPFVEIFGRLDRLERAWLARLSGSGDTRGPAAPSSDAERDNTHG